jgi:hypothetical protein
MKLAQLKELAYEFWTDVLTINCAIIQPTNFQPELKGQFGDLRLRSTWEKALVRFYSQIIYDCCLDAHTLILHSLNIKPGDRLYPYRHDIFEEFLTYSDSLDLLKSGLEQVFQTNNFTPQQQQEARQNGFFELVKEQSVMVF